jgi:hypothetical protein
MRECHEIPECLPVNADILRNVVIDRWQVVTVATEHTDRRGQTGIRVVILQDGAQVYDTGPESAGLVYVSPLHADDSDAALLSAVDLCCHDATHDSRWDAEGLSLACDLSEED